MINLLTPEGQEKLVQEYRHRRRVVGGLLLLSVWLAGLVVGGNLIYEVKIRKTEAKAMLEQTDPSTNDAGEMRTSLRKTNGDIAVLKKLKSPRPNLSALWQRIVADKVAGIRINAWRWESSQKGKVAPVLTLVGLANKRQNLLDFIEKLKQDDAFTAVDSPISNLIKSQNLDFTISLSLNQSE